MTPLQTAMIVVLVIIFVVGMITYFMRSKYYEQIDELDQQKKHIFDQAPHDELKEVRSLAITGQSSELRAQMEAQWHEIETIKYPQLENYLYEAEQATDRYRLNESKKKQEQAQGLIHELKNEIANLSTLLDSLIKQEQENLEKIDAIKKRYHEVRKSLLAYSFSFGPASESFEEKLNRMEEDFTEFSEHTVSGDHEEAYKIIDRLSTSIQETEEQMEVVPELLTQVNENYEKDIEDLLQGYEQMVAHDYLFPEDNIGGRINQLSEHKNQILKNIRTLDLELAKQKMEQIADEIDEVYRVMEIELEAEGKMQGLLADNKQAIYYLQEEIRRLSALEHRLNQSYVLNHNEREILDSIEHQLIEAIEEYEILVEKIDEITMPYSIAQNRLNYLLKKLGKLNDEKTKLSDNLINYRKSELHYKDEMLAMEEAMYNMKRALDNQRLPGLPEDYLELFFSTTKRIENLAAELGQTKVSLTTVRKLHHIAEEDVIQLSKMTEEIIDQVNLIELTSQRLYRFKDEHKGILETIHYSESLFNDEYDYHTSLRLLKEKLENVAPGVFEEIRASYEEEKKSS